MRGSVQHLLISCHVLVLHVLGLGEIVATSTHFVSAFALVDLNQGTVSI